MNSEKYEKLQNDFFEKLEHTYTPGEIKLLIEEYKQKKKDLEKQKKEENDDKNNKG